MALSLEPDQSEVYKLIEKAFGGQMETAKIWLGKSIVDNRMAVEAINLTVFLDSNDKVVEFYTKPV